MKNLISIVVCSTLLYWQNFKEFWTNDKKITGILILFLFLTAIFHSANGSMIREQRDNLALYGLLFCGGIYTLTFIDKVTGIFILYTAWIAFHLGINFQTISIMLVMLSLYIALSNLKVNKEVVYDFIIIIAAANLVYQLAQSLGYLCTSRDGCSQWVGLMGNRNDLSALYAICSAACLRKNRYKFLLIIVTGLFLSVSLGGVIAFTGMIIVWGIRNTHSRYILRAGKYPDTKYFLPVRDSCVPVIAIIIVLGFFVLYGTSVHKFNLNKRAGERFYNWEITTKAALIKPFGWGFGQFEIIVPLLTSGGYRTLVPSDKEILLDNVNDKKAYIEAERLMDARSSPAPFIQAHNEYIEFLFATGFIGLVLMLILIFSTLWKGFSNIDIVPFYGILASCGTALTFFSWQVVPLSVITVIYLAWSKDEYAQPKE